MKPLIISTILLLSLTFSYSQSEIDEQKKPIVAILGTFHFAGSSDLVAMNVSDLDTAKRQSEIQDLVDALTKFKPTKIILEYPYKNKKLDSIFQIYNSGKRDLSINEIQQIGFRLANKMKHNNIYTADHHMDLPFDDLMKFLEKTGRINEFQSIIEYMKNEVLTSMQNTYDNSTIKEYFVWLNSDELDRMNKNIYLQTINNFGADNNYIGSDLVTKWWQRNFRIMRNIDEIIEPNDRILILFGQGHTAILKGFYKDRDDVDYIDVLEYLKN